MSKTILLTAFLLLIAVMSTPLLSEQTSNNESIRLLIMQLNAPQAAVRDQAQNRLIDLGPTTAGSILDSLERQPLPAEIKRRLDQVRAAWETKAGTDFLQAARWGQTEEQKSRVLEAGNLKSALQEIASQTGNPIDVSRLTDDLTIPMELAKTIQPEGADFWPAIDLLVTHGNLEYSWFQRPKSVRVQKSAADRTANPWVAYNGPFRLELTDLIASKRFGVSGVNTIRFNLVLAWEPRLKPVYFVFLPEEAKKREPSNPGTAEGILFDGGSGVEILAGTGMAKPVELAFVLPKQGESGEPQETAKLPKTVSLSGRFAVVIAGKRERFVFESSGEANLESRSAAFPIPVRIDQAAANLKSVRRPDGKTISAQISIEFDEPHNALRSYMNWLNDNRAILILVDGTRIESSAWETVWQSERGAEIRYFFPVSEDKGAAAVQKVEYQSPTAIRQREFSYDFNDISLSF